MKRPKSAVTTSGANPKKKSVGFSLQGTKIDPPKDESFQYQGRAFNS